MPNDQEYSLSELATLAGVTPRTIRYYVSIGLLPSPPQAGPRTKYSDGHLQRLLLIRRLQRQHLPLGEIGGRLQGLDDEAVEVALDRDAVSPEDSALDYIDRLRGAPALARMESNEITPNRSRSIGPRDVDPGSPDPRIIGEIRTRWERVPLADDVELHVRLPVGRQKQKQIERLIRLGREMLEEGE